MSEANFLLTSPDCISGATGPHLQHGALWEEQLEGRWWIFLSFSVWFCLAFPPLCLWLITSSYQSKNQKNKKNNTEKNKTHINTRSVWPKERKKHAAYLTVGRLGCVDSSSRYQHSNNRGRDAWWEDEGGSEGGRVGGRHVRSCLLTRSSLSGGRDVGRSEEPSVRPWPV